MKLFIAPNSAVTFDSAMGYKNNPQLVQNQAADFSFAPDLPQICFILPPSNDNTSSGIPPTPLSTARGGRNG